MTTSTTIDVRGVAARVATRLPWLDSHHSYSFSRPHDPANTHQGAPSTTADPVEGAEVPLVELAA